MPLCARFMWTLAVALLPLTAMAAPATASHQDADTTARQPPHAVGTWELIYDDELLDGESLHPDHERIDQRRTTGHASMINVRAHFIQQLVQLADDI